MMFWDDEDIELLWEEEEYDNLDEEEVVNNEVKNMYRIVVYFFECRVCEVQDYGKNGFSDILKKNWLN